MNRRFCSEACAIAFEDQAEEEIESQSSSSMKGVKIRKRSVVNLYLQRIINFFQPSEQEGYWFFGDKEKDRSRKILFQKVFKARLRQKGLVIDKNTHTIQGLCAADAFDLFFYEDNSDLGAAFEEESVCSAYFEKIRRDIEELLEPMESREDFQAIWDAFLEISGKSRIFLLRNGRIGF